MGPMTGTHGQPSPKQVDMARANRAIQRASVIATISLGIGAVAGYLLLPAIFDFPTSLPARIAFAAHAGVFVLLWVLIAVAMVSGGRRTSPADIDGSAFGPPSERIAVRIAFLQNTLEQAVLAVGLYVALATLLSGAWLSLIVVAAAHFAVGRVLFLRGYPRGAEGRALGMTLTMMPTALGYILAVVLIAGRMV